ncbi:transglycosylase SLT domain-containing protein [Acidovorax sp. PRC11]|uniref:transglycosylase SLT domain-containing protein n=2 Tax=Bacteria TaxID=2 RepID=UPI0028827C9B|nr:transglycosylase SLT domain-containing protein [Acidovorax sp. PRC11]MDT0137012.1 transglycosylase SLT domain-containing protein [Acidovorax sp. PRC11]
MKLLHILGLVSVLWLTGCAAPGSANKDSASGLPSTDGAVGTASVGTAPPLRPIRAANASHVGVASLAAPTDLWDRIRRGFAMPDLDQDLVRDRELWYASRPDYMQRMTERSSKYLFHIVEELELRGMPTELALLPYIESAFNPMAVSSAKAVGMWQFMPATGSDYQLKQNAFRDDRRDVLASTRAALDYLQRLYGMFGDWHLALAAYNWGEGNVGRAIARNQKQGLGTSYTDLNMPAETRMYVPKLQAVKNIVAHPERFNTELPLIENHPYFQTVDITRDIDVSLVASLAGVREQDFRELNPSLHKPIILAAGMPQILLPWDNAQVFRKNLEAYTEGQYASWTVWSVPTTMSVSAAAQRVGMNEADLRSVNQIPPRMLIKAGSALMVPRGNAIQADVPGQLADNGQVAFTPEIVTRRTTVRAGKRDSVATIARRYKVTTADIATWNDVKSTASFKAGESVVVYLPVRASSGVQAAAPARSNTSRQAASRRGTPRKAAAPAATSRKGGTPSRVKKR